MNWIERLSWGRLMEVWTKWLRRLEWVDRLLKRMDEPTGKDK